MIGTQSKVYSVTGYDQSGWKRTHLVSAVDAYQALVKTMELDTELTRVTAIAYAQLLAHGQA